MLSKNIISFYGNTDLGKNRSNNEDAFIVQSIWEDHVVLAAAIDGVGGYEGGEVAASIAKQTIVDYLNEFPNGERADLIKQAVVEANNAINNAREEDRNHPNMSCVMTAVLIDTNSGYLHMAHIGDTRLYQYSDGKIEKLSHDHSLVGYREEIGALTEEEAMHHPQRNVIGRDAGSQFLDINTDLVETASFALISNATYILCSDGLSDMLTSSMMVEILKRDSGVEEKVNALINKANEEGGNDNITVVLVEYTGPSTIVPTPQIVHEEENNPPQEVPDEGYYTPQIVSEVENNSIPKAEEQTKAPETVSVNLFRIEFLLAVMCVLLFVIMCISGYSLYLMKSKPEYSIYVDSTFIKSSLMDGNKVDSVFVDSTALRQVSKPKINEQPK